MDIKVTERGWPGHFICSSDCVFRRNTLIENGDERVVVSTVGNMRRKGDGEPDTIGACGRTYETMAFEAKFEDGYWEPNVSNQLEFNSNWALTGLHTLSDAAANSMHEKVVAEITERMRVK